MQSSVKYFARLMFPPCVFYFCLRESELELGFVFGQCGQSIGNVLQLPYIILLT